MKPFPSLHTFRRNKQLHVTISVNDTAPPDMNADEFCKKFAPTVLMSAVWLSFLWEQQIISTDG